MGCFLACFGHSKKRRKHRKHSNRGALIKDTQIRGSYEPLQSSVPLNLSITEIPVGSDFEFRDKPKIQLRSKIRKKVRFDLNVQVYEPISTDYHLLENDTEEEHNKNIEERTENAASGAAYEGHSYRYQNWLDSCDEDDEIAYGDDDLDDNYSDDGGSDNEDYFSSSKSHSDLNDGKSESVVSEENISKYEPSVLCPIENLTQWKAAKARTKEPPKPQRKENTAVEIDLPIHLSSISHAKIPMHGVQSNVNRYKPKTSDIAVDASLCNWLAAPCLNQFLSLDDKSETAVEAILFRKSSMDVSNLPRYREDQPNLKITDWET